MTTAARDEFLDWDAGTLNRAAYRLGPEQREALRRHLRSKRSAAVLDYFSADPEREQKILDEIRAAFKTGLITSTRQHPLPGVLTSEHLRDVYDDVVGLGPLEALLRDPQVTSISVIRWDTICPCGTWSSSRTA